METSSPPRASAFLATQLYHQLVYTLTDLLPPPLDDSPEALRARNHAAIAKVAALLPANATELDLAAQCIAARAQAEDVLRLIREHAGDIALVMRLNAQYGSMVRTSLAVHGRLMRVQTTRQKREAMEGAASQDAWTQHITEQLMSKVADPRPEPRQPAEPAPPTDTAGQKTRKNVTENKTKSHDTASETMMSEQTGNRGSMGPDGTHLRAVLRQAIAEARSTLQKSPAIGRETLAEAG